MTTAQGRDILDWWTTIVEDAEQGSQENIGEANVDILQYCVDITSDLSFDQRVADAKQVLGIS